MDERARVVVGVDGSPGSRAALKYALRDTARRGGEVAVIAAFEPPGYPDTEYWAPLYGSSAPSLDEVRGEVQGNAERFVREATGELPPELAVPPVTVRAVPGSPSAALLHAAEGAELLVVGSRGRGGFRSMLLGSVSMACALHSPCPVTVVHLPTRSAAQAPEPAQKAPSAG